MISFFKMFRLKGLAPHLSWHPPSNNLKTKPQGGFAPKKSITPRPLDEKGAGFTIIEVLIAVAVITVGIMGILTIIHQTIAQMALSSSRLVATYLAQEGMEIVRNIRDTNWLDPTNPPWNDGLNPGDWEADYNDSSLSSYGASLKINGGFYNYDTGDPTRFKRKITISDPNNPECPLADCFSVKVEVSWQQLARTHQVIVEEYLYNWYQQ